MTPYTVVAHGQAEPADLAEVPEGDVAGGGLHGGCRTRRRIVEARPPSFRTGKCVCRYRAQETVKLGQEAGRVVPKGVGAIVAAEADFAALLVDHHRFTDLVQRLVGDNTGGQGIGVAIVLDR